MLWGTSSLLIWPFPASFHRLWCVLWPWSLRVRTPHLPPSLRGETRKEACHRKWLFCTETHHFPFLCGFLSDMCCFVPQPRRPEGVQHRAGTSGQVRPHVRLRPGSHLSHPLTGPAGDGPGSADIRRRRAEGTSRSCLPPETSGHPR